MVIVLTKSYKEWIKNPSWHGSYDDYKSDMKGMQDYYKEVEQERLAEKIAEKLVKKLKS